MAFFARIALGILATSRGDPAAAAEQYEALDPVNFGIVWAVEDRRIRGLLAQTMGNLDQALAHFEDSLAFCRKAGYRPDLAWTCCDYADALRQRNSEGDLAKAMSLWDESLAVSSELGMRPLIERVLSRREILEA